MSALPPISDHAFWRLVRERYDSNPDRSTPEIAAELGCTAEELVRWVLAYKGPAKRKSVDNSKFGPPLTFDGRAIHSDADLAQRFKNWRRQHVGAAKACA